MDNNFNHQIKNQQQKYESSSFSIGGICTLEYWSEYLFFTKTLRSWKE